MNKSRTELRPIVSISLLMPKFRVHKSVQGSYNISFNLHTQLRLYASFPFVNFLGIYKNCSKD